MDEDAQEFLKLWIHLVEIHNMKMMTLRYMTWDEMERAHVIKHRRPDRPLRKQTWGGLR